MDYVSIATLAEDIRTNLAIFPRELDLVVGLPRSGVLAASMIGLNLNARVCDLPLFLANAELKTGSTRAARSGTFTKPQDAKCVVVVDDSLQSGAAMSAAKESISQLGFRGDVYFCAIYVQPGMERAVDLSIRQVPLPRFFEWNIFHRGEVGTFCVDIDGVLCHDPSSADNDDGAKYVQFLRSARVLMRPTYRVGHLVTSRLEKYRRETEDWLGAHSIAFDELHMLDLPTAEERRRLGVHGAFKAEVYGSLPESPLFIESESAQARVIADRSGKPVLDFGMQRVVLPGIGIPVMKELGRKTVRRGVASLRRRIGF